jgi:hypothetical protein
VPDDPATAACLSDPKEEPHAPTTSGHPPGLTTVLGLAIPAHAESGAVKDVFIEDFQGTTALDDPAFTDRLGYEGPVYEDRVGRL